MHLVGTYTIPKVRDMRGKVSRNKTARPGSKGSVVQTQTSKHPWKWRPALIQVGYNETISFAKSSLESSWV